MKIVPVGFESFGGNTYLIVHQNQALIVDPAVTAGAILEAIRAEDAIPVGILLTHGHFDHMLSMDTLRATYPLHVSIHEEDAEFLADGRKNAFSLFFHKERSFEKADILLKDGDSVKPMVVRLSAVSIFFKRESAASCEHGMPCSTSHFLK